MTEQEHAWGRSESEQYHSASPVEELEEKIECLPKAKVAEAEAKIKDAIENKTAPGEILGSVLGVLKGFFLVVVFALVLTSTCGCLTPPQEVKDANKVEREALLNYAANQAILHSAEQEAFRQEAFAHIDTRFQHDLQMILKQAGEDGKVDAEEALSWVEKVTKERDENRAAVNQQVIAIQEEVKKANKDLTTVLRLDALVSEWSEAGVSADLVQDAADSILEIYKAQSE